MTAPRSALPTGVGGLPTENTARGLTDAGISTAVGAGVGAAVGDGIDTAVGDESGKVAGDGSSTVVGNGVGMGNDAGTGTADRGWRLADRATARNHSRTRRADLVSNASADRRRDGSARRAAEWWSVDVE